MSDKVHIETTLSRDGQNAVVFLEGQPTKTNSVKLVVQEEVGEVELQGDIGNAEQLTEIVFHCKRGPILSDKGC